MKPAFSDGKLYDNGVLEAIRNYIHYGLDPGSFGYACLLGDLALARTKAHYKLLEYPDQDIVANMVEYMEVLPNFITRSAERIDHWIAVGGINGASKGEKALVRLEWPDTVLGKLFIRDF